MAIPFSVSYSQQGRACGAPGKQVKKGLNTSQVAQQDGASPGYYSPGIEFAMITHTNT